MSKPAKMIVLAQNRVISRNLSGSDHTEILKPFSALGYKKIKVFYDIKGVKQSNQISFDAQLIGEGNTRLDEDAKVNWSQTLITKTAPHPNALNSGGVTLHKFESLPPFVRLNLKFTLVGVTNAVDPYLNAQVTVVVLLFEE